MSNAPPSSVPVQSHPLSPDDLPSGHGRTGRRRAPRPVTSFFKQATRAAPAAEDTNGYAHNTYTGRRPAVLRDGSLRPATVRASTLSLVWERPAVPLFIVGSSSDAAPATLGQERPVFSLDAAHSETLHDLPPRAASRVLATQFHTLDDAEIQAAISDVTVLSEEDTNSAVKHPYHSALRVLSEAVDKLGRVRVELEQGRRRLLEKQATVRELVNESGEPRLREAVLAILDDSSASANGDDDYESDAEDGRLSLQDSLSAALAEDLTPTVTFRDFRPPTPSSVRSVTPSDAPPSDRASSHTPALLVSSAPSLSPDKLDSSTPSPNKRMSSSTSSSSSPYSNLHPRLKSRANSSASLASMSSTASKSALSDWMGWFGKARTQSKEQLQSDAAHSDAPTPTKTPISTKTPASAKTPVSASTNTPASTESPTPSDTPVAEKKDTVLKPTSTMRLANGMLSALRMGSASPSPQHRRRPSVSVAVAPRPIPPSVLSSPILGTFSVPPPIPVRPIPAPAKNPEQHPDETPAADTEAPEPPKEDAAPVQGATLRALSNATRVMTADPNSILVDRGQDVGALVARLAWELVCGVRDSGVTFREPARPKRAAPPGPPGPQPSAPEPPGEDDAEGKLKNNLRAAAAGGTVVARKASALGALASPLLVGLAGAGKTRAPVPGAARDEGAIVGGAAAGAGAGPAVGGLPGAPVAGGGALSVPLESIIPATAQPPTQYLARAYTALTAPDFRPPRSLLAGGRFATRPADAAPITDRYGFVYEVAAYDVLLLDRALRAGNSAPGCLTGIKVADREEDDDWPTEESVERAREFDVVRGSCGCVEGVRAGDEEEHDGNEAASVVSTGSSKRSSSRRTLEAGSSGKSSARTLLLSAPLKIASLDYLPAPREGVLVPTHACPNTVRALVARITDCHDEKQARLKTEWNAFLRARRDVRPPAKAAATAGGPARAAGSSAAAAMLGLGAHGAEDDVEELRQSEGLVGFAQMGLAANQGERREFGRLVRGGIPLMYRAKVWLECSGALEMAEPGVFRDLLADAEKAGGVAIVEIEKDVGRTMPLNVFFGGDGVGVDKLRRVLRAYSRRNPGVGYCQGMNLVASTLLLVHADEEDAFWNLACIIEKHLPEDFFSPSLLVSRACPLVLLDYVHDLMPAVFDHLTHLGVDLPAICFSWFLSLFTDCLPVETLFRVWDVFILDGLDVLFRTALAILRINETELLQAKSVPALYVALESLPTRMWEVDKLLKYEADLRPYIVNSDIIKKRDARVKELKDLAPG